MDFTKTTEQDSNYNHLEKMSINELLTHINFEDKTVPFAFEKAILAIEKLVIKGIKILIEELKISEEIAVNFLIKHKNLRTFILNDTNGN